MIEAWFNERGYFVRGVKGESRYTHELPSYAVDDAATKYNVRWIILNQLLDKIQELGDHTPEQDLVLHTDSRLVEELEGDLTPDSGFAKASLQHFVTVDYFKYKSVTITKCAPSTVEGKLSESLSTQ